jgi:hypothetical protein
MWCRQSGYNVREQQKRIVRGVRLEELTIVWSTQRKRRRINAIAQRIRALRPEVLAAAKE